MLKRLVIIAVPVIAVLFIGSVVFQDPVIQSAGFPCVMTENNAEGPYYLKDAPIKEILGGTMEGQRLVVSGQVIDRNCEPVPNAIVDVWQTDADGQYYFGDDYTLRGKIKSDQDGNYTIDTIFPGKYAESGTTRPAHLHIKIFSQEEQTEALTTQLYFAEDKDHDWLVKKSLILDYEKRNNIAYANFDFVIIP